MTILFISDDDRLEDEVPAPLPEGGPDVRRHLGPLVVRLLAAPPRARAHHRLGVEGPSLVLDVVRRSLKNKVKV